MSCVTMPKTMNPDILLNARSPERLLKYPVNTLNRIPSPRLSFKKIFHRMETINILIHFLPYLFRNRNNSVYPPLPFLFIDPEFNRTKALSFNYSFNYSSGRNYLRLRVSCFIFKTFYIIYKDWRWNSFFYLTSLEYLFIMILR